MMVKFKQTAIMQFRISDSPNTRSKIRIHEVRKVLVLFDHSVLSSVQNVYV